MSRAQRLLKRMRGLRECQEVACFDDCGLGFMVPLVFCVFSDPHVCSDIIPSAFRSTLTHSLLVLAEITPEAGKIHKDCF